jgi:hypothetical protein
VSGKKYSSLVRTPRADGRQIRLAVIALAALLLAALLVASSTVVQAQASPAGIAQALTPSQVVVAGTIGDVAQRTVVLRLPSTATNLRFMAQDLTNAAGSTVLPASAVSAELPFSPADSPAPTDTVTALIPLTVTIDLAQAPAGSFTGQALVLYMNPSGAGLPAQQVEAPLALSVSAKQPWPLPAFILFGGVLLGMALTYYRDYMRPRDQLLARLGEVQRRLEADPELAAPDTAAAAGTPAATGGRGREFRAAVEAAVNAALAALRDGDSEQAKTFAHQAEQLLDLWQQQRQNWLAVLALRDELVDKLATLPNTIYIKAVRSSLADAVPTMISAFVGAPQTPTSWESYVKNVATEVDKHRGYLQGYSKVMDQLNAATRKVMEADLPEPERTAKYAELAAIQNDLDNLDPVMDVNASTLLAALGDRVTAVVASLPAPVAVSTHPTAAAMDAAGAESPASLLIWLSNLHMPTLAELGRDKGPRVRLAVFAWGSVILALLLLALVGFNELYANNPTFGAVWLTDYLALLAWGFGAEATRASVTSLVQGWGVMRG